jgi:hypothetical protein
MKTIITVTALLIAITSHSQVSINAGLSSRFSGVFKAAYERQTGWNNTELSTMVSLDNYHPVTGLLTGVGTNHEGQDNYRLMIGAFYHSGLLPVDKDERCQVIKFGASFRWQMEKTLITLDYTGETLNLTIGYLLKRRS